MSQRKKEYRTYSRENYELFLRDNKIKEKELSFQKWKKNLEVCNWMWIEFALRTGIRVSLPFGFGAIAVNKKMLNRFKEYNGKRYVNLRIDWKKSKQHGKRIYHTNEHSEGYNFRWIWFSEMSKIFLSQLYVFKPGRYASRAIAKYIKKPDSDYTSLYLEWKKPHNKPH